MKSRILTNIAIVAAIAVIVLLFVPAVAFPMHIGEPSYYHVARADCIVAACACVLVSFASAVLAHF